MLKIGQFTETFIPVVDGVGRVVLAYANGLAKLGHEVTVIAPMYDTGFRGGFPFEIVDFTSVPVPGMKQYKAGEATWDKHFRQRMKDVDLEIVHAHTPFNAGSEALRVAAKRNLPLVASFHSKYYDDFLKTLKSEALAKVGLKTVVDFYNRCDEVWAVGEATADVLKDYGYSGNVVVMPNGVEERTLDPEALREAEERWGLDDTPVILFVGQLNWKKNILRILEACALLKADKQVFKLVLAGQGPDEKEIEKKVEELNLSDRTVFTGHLTDNKLLDAIYAKATVFAFPSLYDNAPMVVREAAVMGTPSVIVRGSSASDIISDGQNGCLCEDDAKDLAGILKHILTDKAFRERLGENAKNTIPVPWEKILENAAYRYERLVALGKEGKLLKKTPRLVF